MNDSLHSKYKRRRKKVFAPNFIIYDMFNLVIEKFWSGGRIFIYFCTSFDNLNIQLSISLLYTISHA